MIIICFVFFCRGALWLRNLSKEKVRGKKSKKWSIHIKTVSHQKLERENTK